MAIPLLVVADDDVCASVCALSRAVAAIASCVEFSGGSVVAVRIGDDERRWRGAHPSSGLRRHPGHQP